MVNNLTNSILSKKYRSLYFFTMLVIIISIYLVLLFPISPYIDQLEVTTNFIPTFLGGILALTTTNLFVIKDIVIREQTGKSFWQLRDDSVKHLQKVFLIKIVLLFPITFFVAVPLSLFVYTTLKRLYISTTISTICAMIIPLVTLFIWMYSIAKTAKEIKKKIDIGLI